MRQALGLAGRGQVVETFQRLDLTQAEQRQVGRYAVGEALRFERAYRRLQVTQGDLYHVIAVHPDHLTLSNAAGHVLHLQPQRLSAKAYSVGTLAPREVTPGDWVRFTATDRHHGYTNGDRAVVVDIRAERLALRTTQGQQLTLALSQPLPVEYDYARTGQSAQGLGAQRVLLEKETTVRTTNQRSLYTDLTRARDAAVIYTDNQHALPRAVLRHTEKTAALDLVSLASARAQIAASTQHIPAAGGVTAVPHQTRDIAYGYGR